jgi:hypothetical protein
VAGHLFAAIAAARRRGADGRRLCSRPSSSASVCLEQRQPSNQRDWQPDVAELA